MTDRLLHPPARRLPWLRLGHRLFLLLTVLGLLGCAITDLVSSGLPGGVPQAPVEPAQPAQSSPESAALPSATLPPSPTFSPPPPPETATPIPSLTPVPSLTTQPLPTTPAPTLTPFPTQALFPQSTRGCCTLRVFNAGKHSYWIGTHPPTLGNWIKPGKYIEFYFPEPIFTRYYWCIEKKKGIVDPQNPYDCASAVIRVNNGMVTVAVPAR
ncbi:MAG: hypothetical protein ACKOC5_10410 [Chloroflexota bacterium]